MVALMRSPYLKMSERSSMTNRASSDSEFSGLGSALGLAMGYDVGTPYGLVGPKTTEAIRQFQDDQGDSVVDGKPSMYGDDYVYAEGTWIIE